MVDEPEEGRIHCRSRHQRSGPHVSAPRWIAIMFTLGILIAGLLAGSALTAGIGGPEGSPLEPVTDLWGCHIRNLRGDRADRCRCCCGGG